MRKLPAQRCDVLIIGHGAAGLMAAWTLARSGKDVVVIGRGNPATALSSGCVTGLPNLLASSMFGRDAEDIKVAGAKAELGFISMTDLADLRYSRCVDNAIDGLGMAHRAELRPRWTLGTGDLEGAERVDLLPANRGEMEHMRCALQLVKPGASVNVLRPIFPESTSHSMCSSEVTTDRIATVLANSSADLCVIPPLFDLPEFDKGMEGLQKGSGRQLREIFTVRGLPGTRMYRAMRQATKKAGARYMEGAEMAAMEAEGDLLISGRISSGLREGRIETRCLVHCGGGPIGGGLNIEGTKVEEPMHFFDTVASSESKDPLRTIIDQGVRVDPGLHLFHKGVRLRNAVAAGSILPGISYLKGNGIGAVLTTALMAAEEVAHGW